jgi:selenocysteine lyase/cysteine desulfurase
VSAGRLYLDNAATTFPKPPGVVDAVAGYMSQNGSTPGRASYREATAGGEIIRRCRERLCRFLNAPSPDHVVFTLNTTDAINLAVKGAIAHARRAGAKSIHLVATESDHNSVLRPLNAVADLGGIEWTCVPVHPRTGLVDAADIARALRPDTLMVVTLHAGNVTGVIQPAEEIGRVCARATCSHALGRPIFLLDAAQSLGHIEVDMARFGADLIAFPGHKGLLGPLGTGGLAIRHGIERLIDPLREGGTGTVSERDVQPMTMPEKFEPGSHNAPGIAGLSEAVAWLLTRRDSGQLFEHERALTHAMLSLLRDRGCRMIDREDDHGPLADLELLGPTRAEDRIGVFSLVHRTLAPGELAGLLESEFGLLVRPGFHCAPRMHGALGTHPDSAGPDVGGGKGAVRLSFSAMNTLADVTRAVDALEGACAMASAMR